MRVTVWNENFHESRGEEPAVRWYPAGIHAVIAEALEARLGPTAEVRTATMEQPEHGLSAEVLGQTDVLLWWAHMRHHEVDDQVVARVVDAVHGGMGLLLLHSAHISKPFRALIGSTGALEWRNDGDRELVWTASPAHPIAAGIPHPIVIDDQEVYGEPFDIPAPDDVVFISSFSGGEAFRSGVTFRRGRGRIFYFSPGDQDYPVYHQPEIGDVLANAVRWATPDGARGVRESAHRRPVDSSALDRPSDRTAP
ncbi:ThuA domain-containing protein [Microbacterium murale]|uniref:Trehalose utilization protein ThuA n=1 Tax=Microbacterium murale TaxID=1081040 RepID=A0ABQ1RXG3_9MICO|nr:ThuA domain-containing protein [Microbacterium murale]GGD86199.1 trehalose utilization protein ThuA [Microbacterium murale]